MINSGKFELEEIIKEALNELYLRDEYLINMKVHEQAIVFRFALYFIKALEEIKYNEYDCDIEYNRKFSSPKQIADTKVRPDLILHKRGSNDDNLLVIEFKTYWNCNIAVDENKLKELTKEDGGFGYKWGISILLEKSLEKCKIEWIKNGGKYE